MHSDRIHARPNHAGHTTELDLVPVPGGPQYAAQSPLYPGNHPTLLVGRRSVERALLPFRECYEYLRRWICYFPLLLTANQDTEGGTRSTGVNAQ